MYRISWGKVVFSIQVKETQLGGPRGNCLYQDYQLTISCQIGFQLDQHSSKNKLEVRLAMSRPELQFQHSTEFRRWEWSIILRRANNKLFFSIKVISVVSTIER